MSKVEQLAPVSSSSEAVSCVIDSSLTPPPGVSEELFKEDNQVCFCLKVKC